MTDSKPLNCEYYFLSRNEIISRLSRLLQCSVDVVSVLVLDIKSRFGIGLCRLGLGRGLAARPIISRL